MLIGFKYIYPPRQELYHWSLFPVTGPAYPSLRHLMQSLMAQSQAEIFSLYGTVTESCEVANVDLVIFSPGIALLDL